MILNTVSDIPETWPCMKELITPLLHEESFVTAHLREPLLPPGKASLLLARSRIDTVFCKAMAHSMHCNT